MPDPPKSRVLPPELRRKWHENRFPERLQSGEFRQEVRRDGHPSPALANEPHCTRSQIVYCFDSSNKLAAVYHQYLRQDRTIGASGQPDPKRLLIGGVIYYV